MVMGCCVISSIIDRGCLTGLGKQLIVVHLGSRMVMSLDSLGPIQCIRHISRQSLHWYRHILLLHLLLSIYQLHSLLPRPLLNLAFQSRIVMILNMIVCPPR